jgi:hypothetical protein
LFSYGGPYTPSEDITIAVRLQLAVTVAEHECNCSCIGLTDRNGRVYNFFKKFRCLVLVVFFSWGLDQFKNSRVNTKECARSYCDDRESAANIIFLKQRFSSSVRCPDHEMRSFTVVGSFHGPFMVHDRIWLFAGKGHGKLTANRDWSNSCDRDVHRSTTDLWKHGKIRVSSISMSCLAEALPNC